MKSVPRNEINGDQGMQTALKYSCSITVSPANVFCMDVACFLGKLVSCFLHAPANFVVKYQMIKIIVFSIESKIKLCPIAPHLVYRKTLKIKVRLGTQNLLLDLFEK